MKTYTFPVGGSFGKGDSWDGVFDFALTDEESERLASVARTMSKWDVWLFEDVEEVQDIYEKVLAAEYENEIQSTIKGMIDDLRSDYEGDEQITDRELAEQYIENSTMHVGFPEILCLGEREEEEEE